jgi:hydroxylaminobenzene mutase
MEERKMTRTARERLIWHGMFLFLMGLLTGFLIPVLTNPRLGLSAHVEALLNGMFLVILGGVVWNNLKLSDRMAKLALWLFLFAAYANWLFCLLAGVFGASEILPIASAGHTAAPWQEIPVRLGLSLGAVGITLACVCVLFGLRGESAEGS